MSPTSYQAAPPRVSSSRITGGHGEFKATALRNVPVPATYHSGSSSGGLIEFSRVLVLVGRDVPASLSSRPSRGSMSSAPRFAFAFALATTAAVAHGGAQQSRLASTGTAPAAPAELPRATVSTSYPSGGRAVRVAANANLQAAIDAARPGDVLLLPPGATYVGNFRLRAKPAVAGATAGGWIVIRTDVPDASLG